VQNTITEAVKIVEDPVIAEQQDGKKQKDTPVMAVN
jgi:hypothetical protein